MRPARTIALASLLALTGCSTQPYRTPPPAPTPTPRSGEGPTLPVPPPVPTPGTTDPVITVPPPAPVPRERPRVAPATLSPASTALVTQAQAQRKRGDLPGATVSLERALRIEPSNPLLWIEMGRLRMDQRNFAQAEAMGRKAVSMAIGDNRTQASAWALVAEALQARGRNPEAQEALDRSRALSQL
jgi:hypothetical protein